MNKAIIALLILCPVMAQAKPAKTNRTKARTTIAARTQGTRQIASNTSTRIASAGVAMTPESAKTLQQTVIEIDEGD
ncbi:MAG: hypothetical protein V4760_16175 [Bdellovibrionota bacterium]